MTPPNSAPQRGAANSGEATPNANAQVPGAQNIGNASGIQGHGIADVNMNAMMNQFGGLGINGHQPIPGMVPVATPDGRIVYIAANYPAHGMAAAGIPAYAQASETIPAAYGAPYIPYTGYNHQLMQQSGLGPYTPARVNVAHDRSETSSREVPGLDIRRSSNSTNESLPATPFFGSMISRDQGARIAVFDRSTYNTPSPQQILVADDEGDAKRQEERRAQLVAEGLTELDPKIPAAIPAIFTDRVKTLEQSLDTKQPGNRNVYIRGLHPTTDDDLLLKYAERFGPVESSKAIIEGSTGACKG